MDNGYVPALWFSGSLAMPSITPEEIAKLKDELRKDTEALERVEAHCRAQWGRACEAKYSELGATWPAFTSFK